MANDFDLVPVNYRPQFDLSDQISAWGDSLKDSLKQLTPATPQQAPLQPSQSPADDAQQARDAAAQRLRRGAIGQQQPQPRE
jgi:hypothetical protein